jgi:chemotaxis protein methyltransferase CheR
MITQTPLTHEQISRLSDLLAARCGLEIGDASHPAVLEGLARLMARTGSDSFEAFYARVTELGSALRDQLANAMISRETAWFRDPKELTAIASSVVPALEERLACGSNDRIRIWSAGCSTGQEPYSVVMTLLVHLEGRGLGERLPAHYEIIGTDISPAALFLAVAGRYDARALHTDGLAAENQRRFFEDAGRVSCVRDAIRRSVRFRQHNLLDRADGLASGPFDIVLLRHVLEYYTAAHQQEILARVSAGMTPEGVLFLGAGDALPANDLFQEISVEGCVCFRRR